MGGEHQWLFMPAAVMKSRISQANTPSDTTLAVQITSNQPMRCHNGFFSASCTSRR